MNLLCSLKGHDPSPDEVCNDGRCFTRCRRCGAELMREGDKWQPLPRGFRVVWKPAEADAPPPPPPPAPPAPPAEPERAPAPPPPPPPSSQAGLHILVADDDPLVTDILRHKLSSRGYRVTVAADGREALERIAQGRPDAILLDAMMPMVDGYEVLRRLRADPALAAVPVIMLTARKQEGDIVSALELGADDFVVKPFIPEELLSRLGRLLAR
jgi:CheY-like chemotaxis protein